MNPNVTISLTVDTSKSIIGDSLTLMFKILNSDTGFLTVNLSTDFYVIFCGTHETDFTVGSSAQNDRALLQLFFNGTVFGLTVDTS